MSSFSCPAWLAAAPSRAARRGPGWAGRPAAHHRRSPPLGRPAHHLRSYRRAMTEVQPPRGNPREVGRYEIRLQGRLDARWAAWFDGLSLTTESGGTTLLRGPVADQAALHGLLQ